MRSTLPISHDEAPRPEMSFYRGVAIGLAVVAIAYVVIATVIARMI